MKKHKIKKVAYEVHGNLIAEEIEAEIYEYKGLQFGLFWTKEHGKAIRAIELQTGCLVGKSRSKQDLLRQIADFVDNYDYESVISFVRDERERNRMELNEKIRKLEQQRDCLVFPINERIEL